MTVRRRLGAALAVLVVLAGSGAGSEEFRVPEVFLYPAGADGGGVVGQGRVFAVVVSDPDASAVVALARWGEQTIPCLSGPDRTKWRGVGGAGREAAPGTYALEVIITETDGRRFLIRKNITVTATRFSTGRLTVDPKMINVPDERKEWVEEDRLAFEGSQRRGALRRYWEGPFRRPVDGAVSSPFGRERTYNNSYKSVHTGTDLKAARGTPVHAAAAGVVVLVREAYISGHTVVVDHGGGLYTSYSHLGEFLVAEGQEVARGDVVGKVGLTGRITGPHLHWGCTVQGVAVDPLSLFELTSISKIE